MWLSSDGGLTEGSNGLRLRERAWKEYGGTEDSMGFAANKCHEARKTH